MKAPRESSAKFLQFPFRKRICDIPRLPVRSFIYQIRESFLMLHHRFVQSLYLEKGEHPSSGQMPNFRAVSDRLFAGGQPTDAGYAWLAANGFGTILNLRKKNFQSARWPQFKHVDIPVRDRGVPTFDDAETFLRTVDDPKNGKVYIHCRGGTGRAKTMLACWQIAHGMPAEDAILEADTRGVRLRFSFFFNASITLHFSLNEVQKDFLRRFETHWLEKQIIRLPRRMEYPLYTQTVAG